MRYYLLYWYSPAQLPSVANSPLKEEDLKWLENQIDEVIKRLHSCLKTLSNEKNAETNSANEMHSGRIVDIQSISFYANKEKDEMLFKLEGIKFYD